jgi:hypothetical protein
MTRGLLKIEEKSQETFEEALEIMNSPQTDGQK